MSAVLHLPTFLAKIKAAQKNKTLTIYDKEKFCGSDGCCYQNERGFNCIVGAGLAGQDGFGAITDPEGHNNSTSFSQLVTEGLVECPAKYVSRIDALQKAYDKLAGDLAKSTRPLRHKLRWLEATARRDYPEYYATN